MRIAAVLMIALLLAGCSSSGGSSSTTTTGAPSTTTTAPGATTAPASTTTLPPSSSSGPADTNHAPSIDSFEANATGLAVEFTFAATDADADPLTFVLSFGDGSTDATGALPKDNVTYMFAAAGTYSANLTVSDGELTATKTLLVEAGAGTGVPLLPVRLFMRSSDLPLNNVDTVVAENSRLLPDQPTAAQPSVALDLFTTGTNGGAIYNPNWGQLPADTMIPHLAGRKITLTWWDQPIGPSAAGIIWTIGMWADLTGDGSFLAADNEFIFSENTPSYAAGGPTMHTYTFTAPVPAETPDAPVMIRMNASAATGSGLIVLFDATSYATNVLFE